MVHVELGTAVHATGVSVVACIDKRGKSFQRHYYSNVPNVFAGMISTGASIVHDCFWMDELSHWKQPLSPKLKDLQRRIGLAKIQKNKSLEQALNKEYITLRMKGE